MFNVNSKVKILIILVITVLGLSIGFAAFSSTLTISSTADIVPETGSFNVGLSKISGGLLAGNISPTINSNNSTANDINISNDNSSLLISGASVVFRNSGTVTYTFYAYNAGQYVAYLNSVVFNNVTGTNSFKRCEAISGTTQQQLTTACNSLSYQITIGSSTYTSTNANISNHELGIGDSETIVITITNNANEITNFSFEFGTIDITYGSID